MKIVVTGGRSFTDQPRIYHALDELHNLHPITHLLHGAAIGVDSICADWAVSRNVPVLAMHAQWELYGRSAGPMRNIAMADTKPDICVHFPGGKGTAHMVNECRKRDITLWEG